MSKLMLKQILFIFTLIGMLPLYAHSSSPAGEIIEPPPGKSVLKVNFPNLEINKGNLGCRMNARGRTIPRLVNPRTGRSIPLRKRMRKRLKRAADRGLSSRRIVKIRRKMRQNFQIASHKQLCKAVLSEPQSFIPNSEGELPEVVHPLSPFPGKSLCEAADYDGDGDTSRSDLMVFLKEWRKQSSVTDLNGSGSTDIEDLKLFFSLWGSIDNCDPWSRSHDFTALPMTSAGWTDFNALFDHPDYYNDSKVVYVSDSEGSDSSGRSYDIDDSRIGGDPFRPSGEINPYKTIAEAYGQLREGYPDILLLKRGDIWSGQILGSGKWARSGRSKRERMVVGAYGQEGPRPKIITHGSVIRVWGLGADYTLKNVAFTGVHLHAVHKDPNHDLYDPMDDEGAYIRFLQASSDILFEDLHLEYVSWILQFDEVNGKNIAIRRTVTERNYSSPTPGGHSQGIYTKGVIGLLIEESIFDHNGFIDRDCATPTCVDSSQGATIFNHNLYLQHGSGPAIVRDNIISRASSHGIQARAGGVIENNLLMRNPLTAFVAGGAVDPLYKEISVMRDNVVLEGNDINSATPRGMALDHNNAYQSLIERNIVANMLPETSEHNNRAFTIICNDDANEQCSSIVRNNITYNWSNEDGRANGIQLSVSPAKLTYFALHDNLWSKRGFNSGGDMVSISNYPEVSHLLDIKGNKYFHPEIFQAGSHGGTFNIGSGSTNFSTWQSEVEPDATAATSYDYPDPCRTAATYYHEVILGNDPAENCDVMHDDDLFESFMENAINRSRFSGPDAYKAYSANTVNNYIRQGFGMKARD